MPAETHVEQSPIDRQEVFELIRDRLADILETLPDGTRIIDYRRFHEVEPLGARTAPAPAIGSEGSPVPLAVEPRPGNP